MVEEPGLGLGPVLVLYGVAVAALALGPPGALPAAQPHLVLPHGNSARSFGIFISAI